MASNELTIELEEGETLFFVLHHRASSHGEARYLHDGLCAELSCSPKQAFIDAYQLTDLSQLLKKHVAKTRVLLLLQAEETLQRPFVLAEVYTAFRFGIPVIPVKLSGKGYDFDRVQARLQSATGFAEALEKENAGSVAGACG